MKNNMLKKNHVAFKEWIYLSIFLLLTTAALTYFNGLGKIDQSIYDQFLQRQNQPAREDIIIVAIDDYSLQELGKWPWPRSLHAQLIEQINTAQPLAIGLDVLFPESDNVNVADDQLLAQAIASSGKGGKVILPITLQNAGQGLVASLPTAILANSTRSLSHIHLELDSDGIARSVFLYEGMNQQWWPHFSLALYDFGQGIQRQYNDAKPLPGARAQLIENETKTDNASTSSNDAIWKRDFHMHIPFYGSSGHFTSVPYVAVLRGEVPADFFKNKYVLIGTTAQGMADSYTTPVTSNQGAISGIEINANVLASLLDDRSITIANPWITAITCISIVFSALLCLFFFSPRVALGLNAVLFISLLGLSFLLLQSGVWLPPAAGLMILIVAYPLWSWRRLEAAIQFLGEEFILLNNEPHLLPEHDESEQSSDKNSNSNISTANQQIQDKLERHINAMHTAARRVRDLRQFVTDSLYSLPDATLVCNKEGNVVLANPTAMVYFKSIGSPNVIDALVPYLFSSMNFPTTELANHHASFSWWHLLDLKQSTLLIKGVEVRDQKGRDIIIKSAPCFSGSKDKELVGWILSLIDISAIRQAERRREESLHFISHDMRAPQSSILALLELQKNPDSALKYEALVERIEKAARTTLGLADSFVQLAQAEANEYRLHDYDFQDILLDATEELWSIAKSKNIHVVTNIPDYEFIVRVDRSLMTRVLVNLISNAIKYSPPDTTVTCSLALETQSLNDTVVCTIQDQGYGIAREDQSRLFKRFERFQHNKHGEQRNNDGIGLGMVFVKTVIDRHYADISFTSVPGEGTTFVIRIAAQP
jgi:CHASE2 domain-containing sensor protein/signal transduction histidine kinase